MILLEIYLGDQLVGGLGYDSESSLFTFEYTIQWLGAPDSYAISPSLPLEPVAGEPQESRSRAIRYFFDNLLPEGRALEDAAARYNVSKSNLVGLLIHLGKETTGAIRVALHGTRDDIGAAPNPMLRQLPHEEMSKRIKTRPFEPFSIWDGKVRLSIAGFQDKIAVFKEGESWSLVEGGGLASTHILKPDPLSRNLPGLTSNEFFCMRLAKNVGIPVAPVRLVHVPEPILEIERFDRVASDGRVRRLHAIDGCQALGLFRELKTERWLGNGEDVKNIREGASLPKIFGFLSNTRNPTLARVTMLRLTIFNVLTGNTDAHAKNFSFFSNENGFSMTPAYDLVSVLGVNNERLEDEFAMAIGDAFTEDELSPFQWAEMAASCGLPVRAVSVEIARMVRLLQKHAKETLAEVVREGASLEVVENILIVIERMCIKHAKFAPGIPKVGASLLGPNRSSPSTPW